MSETHTPGPWYRQNNKSAVAIYSDHKNADHRATTVCSLTAISPSAKRRSSANAALICAAPELLAACEAALPVLQCQSQAEHMLDGFGPRTPRHADVLVDQIRAAISKAKGPTDAD